MSAPTQIAHYRITGEGGMGAVCRGSDLKLNRDGDWQRFLIAEPVAEDGAEQPGIQLVLNWAEGLK